MLDSSSPVTPAILNAWRGQLAATGKRLGLRTHLLQHHQELLPRFAAVYRQLRALPRQLRKMLQRRWGVSLAGVALLLTLQPRGSHAADFTAGTAAELVTAINTANSNGEADTITLTADITLPTAYNPTYGPTGLPVVSSAITIAGNHHTIRRDPSNPAHFRLLAINGRGNLTLQDTTLSGGSSMGGGTSWCASRGGGICNFNGQLTLEGCIVSGNSAVGSGGGVYSRSGRYGILNIGTMQLTSSLISGNSAGQRGGGVYLTAHYSGSGQILNSTISGNTAGSGGGVFFFTTTFTTDSSTAMIINSTVSDNTATGSGGGAVLHTFFGGTVTLMNSTVSGNTAGGNSGGVVVYSQGDGTVALVNSTVSGNMAGGNGGGVIVSNEGDGTATLMNNMISGNSAFNVGGGAFLFASFGGTVVFGNSTVSGNTADVGGGGVELFASTQSTVTLTNSTVSGNTAGDSGGGVRSGVYLGSVFFPPGKGALSRNLISGNSAPTAAEFLRFRPSGPFSATLNLLGHTGLTTAQALSGFPAVGNNIVATSDVNKPTALAAILDSTLRNNGGPTLTHNLVSNSPAIDAAGATCDLTTDQRGAPRPVDGNSDGVADCDIGAVEFGATPPPFCGNGVVEAGEQCDDGNTVSGDGCSATCQLENPQNRPPDCSTATASVTFPRLGNRHRYPVTIDGVTAPPGDTVSLTITSIFQDEPVTNPTGKTCPDGVGVGTDVAKVRNEWLLAGDGRVYHIGFTATDSEGASCTGEVQVCVPAKEGEACGDQGALFDSTACPSQD